MEQATTTLTTTATTTAVVATDAPPSAGAVVTPAVMPARRSKLLQRGESAVASFGVALAALILGAVGVSAWWVQHTQSATAEGARAEQLRTVGDLTGQNAEALLAAGELSAVRRMLAETGASYDLSDCRIVLSNGQVVASSDPSGITAQTLPDSWHRNRPLDDTMPDAPDGSIAMSYPLRIAGRGDATLEIVAPLAQGGRAQWEATAGVGTIGAVAMGGLLVTYRVMRGRIRASGLIREALIALGAGETSPAVLNVPETLGPEAKVWNGLVAERERARKQGVAERARETLGNRRQGKGDLSVACDALSHGLILIDEKGLVSYANGAAAVFLRAKREDLAGADVGRFLQVEPVMSALREIVTGTARRRTVHDVERTGDDGQGAGVLRFSVRPVRREDNAVAMVTIEDITQQKVAEEARHAFVAQATHELRTPLTNIRLYVETAIEDGENDPQMRSQCLNVINGETRRLERIVGEMLSVAEIEAGAFKLNADDVTLQTVFDDLQTDYAAQAKDKSITLTFNMPPKLPLVKGDRDKILMALHNLVGNALKYTPNGGKVNVTVSSTAKNLVVEVQDSGIGIGPEDAEKVFERFYRAKDPRVGKITGTGLGLTIAREAVRLHGGDITLESQINQGSTFTITLPVVAEAA